MGELRLMALTILSVYVSVYACSTMEIYSQQIPHSQLSFPLILLVDFFRGG